jgi:sulfoxide reductase heme-binding subunit YedZ
MDMRGRLVNSLWAFRLLLAVPAAIMLGNFLMHGRGWGQLIDQSGEWAIRLLILTLAITPLRLLMKQLGFGPHWPMWLFKRRRSLGLAAFLYASLHASAYLIRQANLNVVLFDLRFAEYLTGWIAFLGMLLLAATSNDDAVHRLGLWWKMLQRLAYVAMIAAAVHWYLIRLDHTALWLHVLPLAALEAYRIWYNFARPAGIKH